jgi:hypothetical protein
MGNAACENLPDAVLSSYLVAVCCVYKAGMNAHSLMALLDAV